MVWARVTKGKVSPMKESFDYAVSAWANSRAEIARFLVDNSDLLATDSTRLLDFSRVELPDGTRFDLPFAIRNGAGSWEQTETPEHGYSLTFNIAAHVPEAWLRGLSLLHPGVEIQLTRYEHLRDDVLTARAGVIKHEVYEYFADGGYR